MKEQTFENHWLRIFQNSWKLWFHKYQISESDIYWAVWIGKKSTPRHTIVKLQDMFYNDLKNRNKRQSTYKGMTNKLFNSTNKNEKVEGYDKK